jgi:ribosomal protein S18 acetylase RimI-like enzyme
MSYRVRRARDGDYDRLCQLWEQLDGVHAGIQPAFFRWPPHPRPRSDLRQALDDRYRDMFVAEAPGRPSGPIIGVVSLHIYDVSDQPMMLQGRRAYVEDLVVDQAYRGRGVGRQLMEAAHNWTEHHGARQVVLTVWNGNREAQQFYEQVGYRPINQVLVRDVD